VSNPLRGSQKHVLDWVSSPNFRTELNTLLRPAPAFLAEEAKWMPRSHGEATEARLETFGPAYLGDTIDWKEVGTWWLQFEAGANTPNWDFASTCNVEDGPGLLLVEAKAHHRELSKAGKRLSAKASERSRANHEHISKAIQQACVTLAGLVTGVSISLETHYQLSNRIAFACKLASLGLPTVLTYLGFTRDWGIADAGPPFADDAEWRKAFHDHAKAVFPSTACEIRIDSGKAPFWVLVRSRDVMSPSPPRPR
jgi:hypothetical protein